MIEGNSHFIPTAIIEEVKEGAISVMYPLAAKPFLKYGGKGNPKIKEFLTDIIEKRLHDTENKRNDILQALINTRDSTDQDDRLTVDEIREEIALFLIAGSDTLSNTVGFAIINLLRKPDRLSRLVAEIDEIHQEEGQLYLTKNNSSILLI